MVVGPGSPKFDDAYFEVNYVRAYTNGVPTPTAAVTTITSTTTANPTSLNVEQKADSSAASLDSPLLLGNVVVILAGLAAALYTLNAL